MREELTEAINRLIQAYRTVHKARLDEDPSFAGWMESQYVPIAGAWQY